MAATATARTTPSKRCVSILLWNIAFILELSSVFVGIKTCPCWICYERVQLQIEIRNISRCGSRSPDNAEFGHLTLLFCRGQQRNVPRIITHVHSHCFAHKTFLFGDVLVAVAVVLCLRSSYWLMRDMFWNRSCQDPVVRGSDNAIHRINHHPANTSMVCFVNTYPLDSDLSGG